MRLLSAIYETLIVCIQKLRSTRERLLWTCILLWMWTLKRTDDPVIMSIVGGWVGTVVAFYFYNKMKMDDHDHQQTMAFKEPPIVRDPDKEA